MNLTADEQATLEAYENLAAGWVSSHNSEDFWDFERATFRQLVPTGNILEIGCGGGRDARYLIEDGYQYTGVDFSPALLKIAQAANPKGSFRQMSLYDLDLPDASFDGWWAAAVLLHIPKKRLAEALASLSRVLKPGGTGFISVKEGEGEQLVPITQDGKEYKRLFSFFSTEEMTTQLTESGFTVRRTGSLVKHQVTWLTFFVERPGS